MSQILIKKDIPIDNLKRFLNECWISNDNTKDDDDIYHSLDFESQYDIEVLCDLSKYHKDKYGFYLTDLDVCFYTEKDEGDFIVIEKDKNTFSVNKKHIKRPTKGKILINLMDKDYADSLRDVLKGITTNGERKDMMSKQALYVLLVVRNTEMVSKMLTSLLYDYMLSQQDIKCIEVEGSAKLEYMLGLYLSKYIYYDDECDAEFHKIEQADSFNGETVLCEYDNEELTKVEVW